MSVHKIVDCFETKHVHLNFCPVQDVILELAFPTREIFINPKSHFTLGFGASLQFSSISEFVSLLPKPLLSWARSIETTTMTYRKIYCIQSMQDIKTNRNKISC